VEAASSFPAIANWADEPGCCCFADATEIPAKSLKYAAVAPRAKKEQKAKASIRKSLIYW
jgi:hypothetical protein